MRSADANIFIRYLTGDDPAKADACGLLFERVEAGLEELLTTEIVIAEVVYVLSSRSQYGRSNEDIAGRLKLLLAFPGLHLANKQRCLRALDLYAASPFLDFEDAMLAILMQEEGITEIYSYDRDFDRVDGVSRIEP